MSVQRFTLIGILLVGGCGAPTGDAAVDFAARAATANKPIRQVGHYASRAPLIGPPVEYKGQYLAFAGTPPGGDPGVYLLDPAGRERGQFSLHGHVVDEPVVLSDGALAVVVKDMANKRYFIERVTNNGKDHARIAFESDVELQAPLAMADGRMVIVERKLPQLILRWIGRDSREERTESPNYYMAVLPLTSGMMLGGIIVPRLIYTPWSSLLIQRDANGHELGRHVMEGVCDMYRVTGDFIARGCSEASTFGGPYTAVHVLDNHGTERYVYRPQVVTKGFTPTPTGGLIVIETDGTLRRVGEDGKERGHFAYGAEPRTPVFFPDKSAAIVRSNQKPAVVFFDVNAKVTAEVSLAQWGKPTVTRPVQLPGDRVAVALDGPMGSRVVVFDRTGKPVFVGDEQEGTAASWLVPFGTGKVALGASAAMGSSATAHVRLYSAE
jgi:hypothetical protein